MLESATHRYLKIKIQRHLDYKKEIEKQIIRATRELEITTLENELMVETLIINFLRKRLQKLAY